MIALPTCLTPVALPMPATLGAVNVYLVRGPGGAALVDTGMDDAASRAALAAALAASGLSLRDLGAVVCTHYHPDHCGLGATLIDAGAEVMMSVQDTASLAAFFDDTTSDSRRSTFYGRHRVPAEFEERVTAMFPFFRSLQEPFRPTRTIADGETVLLAGIPFEVMHTPGHTRGHVCLFEPQSGVLLTGDHVTPGEATHVSMREETIGADPLGAFLRSLERVLTLGPRVGLSGHGEPIPDTSVRADEILRHHAARLTRVAASLESSPLEAYDLCVKVFGDRRKTFARWQSMSQTLAYLEHLVHEGRAVEVATEHGTAAYVAP
jgi:glyoxylase-like metal-dependent hydrolase (beta-lactamase superfamily II)